MLITILFSFSHYVFNRMKDSLTDFPTLAISNFASECLGLDRPKIMSRDKGLKFANFVYGLRYSMCGNSENRDGNKYLKSGSNRNS